MHRENNFELLNLKKNHQYKEICLYVHFYTYKLASMKLS